MNFKKIVTLVLLGILALLMIRSVQAADVVPSAGTELAKTAIKQTKETVTEIAKNISWLDWAEEKTTFSPVTLIKKAWPLCKDHPVPAVATGFVATIGLVSYWLWRDKYQGHLKDLMGYINEDHRTTNGHKHETTVLDILKDKYRTSFMCRDTNLQRWVNIFYGNSVGNKENCYIKIDAACNPYYLYWIYAWWLPESD